jgi:hypothetical protein
LFEIFIDQDTIGLKGIVVSEKIKMTEKTPTTNDVSWDPAQARCAGCNIM